MNNNILVTIIVPVYNTELFIRKCIDSLTDQSYDNIEIVLIDDGSTDSSGKICDEYANRDKRIKVIHKKNEGVVKARIDAYDNATGDYVTFVDSDDYLSLDAISLMVDYVVKYQVDMVVCQYTDVYEDKFKQNKRSIKGLYSKNEIKELLKSNILYDPKCYGSGIHLHLWGKLIKKDLLQDVLSKAEGQWFGEDLICSLHIINKVNKMYVSDDHIYYYVHHPAEAINRNQLEKWPAFELVWKRIIEFDTQDYFKNQLPYRIWAFTETTYDYILSIQNLKLFTNAMNMISSSFYVRKYILNNPKFKLESRKEKLIYFILKYKLFTTYYMYKKIRCK